MKGYDAPDDVWYASEKARIEGGGERKMLDAGGEEDGEDEAPLQIEAFKAVAPPEQQQGLLGSSTLAALQGFKGSNGQKKGPDKVAGPLVGYGSDSEEEDE